MNILNAVHGLTAAQIVAATALAAMNVVAFICMGVDKHRAQKGTWRISERRLLCWCACFGAFGGLLGMYFFHHKIKHKKFTVLVPLFLFLQVLLLILYVVQRG